MCESGTCRAVLTIGAKASPTLTTAAIHGSGAGIRSVYLRQSWNDEHLTHFLALKGIRSQHTRQVFSVVILIILDSSISGIRVS